MREIDRTTLTYPCNNMEKSKYQFCQIHVTILRNPCYNFDKSNNFAQLSSPDWQGNAMIGPGSHQKYHHEFNHQKITSPTISSLSSSTRLPTKLLKISNSPKIIWNMELAKQSLHSNIYKNGWKHATLSIAPKYTISRYGKAANLFRSQSEVITAPC